MIVPTSTFDVLLPFSKPCDSLPTTTIGILYVSPGTNMTSDSRKMMTGSFEVDSNVIFAATSFLEVIVYSIGIALPVFSSSTVIVNFIVLVFLKSLVSASKAVIFCAIS